jgi:hypothetical protein
MRLFGSEGHLAVLPKAFDDLHLHGAFRFLRRKGTAGTMAKTLNKKTSLAWLSTNFDRSLDKKRSYGSGME